MELGIGYWFGYPSFPEERTYLLKNHGFQTVSLHWTNEYEAVTGKKETVYEALSAQGIATSSFHLSYDRAHLLWEEGELGIRYRKNVMLAIEDAALRGVPIVIMHTNGKTFSPMSIHYLEDIIDAAQKVNVQLCLENLQKEDNLANILHHFEGQNLAVCYDAGHANIRPCPFPVSNNTNIRYLHLSDNHGLEDEHLIPGRGTVAWDSVVYQIQSLKDIVGIAEVHAPLQTRDAAESYLDDVVSQLEWLKHCISHP